MSATTATPLPGDIQLPEQGVWRIDPGHAEVSFTGRHLMLTKVRGRFRGIEGVITIADDPNDSTVRATIDMASVDSGDRTRDDHLRSSDLFDVEAHPVAHLRSTAVTVNGRDLAIDADLTIKGVARPVRLEGTYLGVATDPWGTVRAVFSARTRVDREAWGLTWNMALEAGGLLVSKEIDLEIEFEAIPEIA